jgi:hypothetical protein
VGGGVQLGPLGTVATNSPIVPAAGNYIDGMMIGRGNRSTRRKPVPVPLCPTQTPHVLPRREPGQPRGKPATNRLSYGATLNGTLGKGKVPRLLTSVKTINFFGSSPQLVTRNFQELR